MTEGSGDAAISLRAVVAEDRAFLLDVYSRSRAEELQRLPFTPEQAAAFCEQQFEAQSRYYAEQYADASFDVIVHRGEPVGRLIVARRREEVRIAEIALLPAACGQGLGTEVLRRVLLDADARGVPATIHVEPANPAARLYRRLGFTALDGDPGGVRVLLRRPPAGTAQPKTTS